MNSEKIRLFIIELALMIFFLLAMIFNNIFTRQLVAVILLVFMVITMFLLKTDKQKLTNNTQIKILLGIFGAIYIIIIYVLGIFAGFYISTIKLSLWSIQNYIIPYIVIIISVEIIRKRILLKETKVSKIIITIAMVILDILLWTNIYNLKTRNDYFTLITFIVFSSIANNCLYNYIIIKHRNSTAIIIYRIITTLYMYIIPITPDIHIFVESVIKLIFPYIIYIILEHTYNNELKVITIQQKQKAIIINVILCIVTALIVMLISCKFKYGVLVIGSGSMTGTINKGDIIIYEQYEEKEQIKTKDIIIFTEGSKYVVHRIINQNNLGNETRYYTKGDANLQEDDGYRLREDIIGRVRLRIPYIGYFTLWINNLFEFK